MNITAKICPGCLVAVLICCLQQTSQCAQPPDSERKIPIITNSIGIKLARIPAGKFMMGSDGFLNPLSVSIGPVVFAPIGDEEKRGILGLNVARLLDKAGALPEPLRKKGSPG